MKVKELFKRRQLKGRTIDNIQLFTMQMPALINLLIFHYIPLYGIVIAFKDFNPNLGIWDSPWVGFENFKYFFVSGDAAYVIRNTILYRVWFEVLHKFAAVSCALFLYHLTSKKALKVYNTIMILPHFMSIVLIAFMVYAILNPVSGILNNIIVAFGGEAIDWYAKPGAWPAILSIVSTWMFVGWQSIIYYATLMGINMELFEAAAIDGANRLKQTWYIAIPHLVPILCIQLVLGASSILGGDFGLHYQVTRNVSLLYPTTDILATYNFRNLMSGDMSISQAVGQMVTLVGMMMVFLANAIVRKLSPENAVI